MSAAIVSHRRIASERTGVSELAQAGRTESCGRARALAAVAVLAGLLVAGAAAAAESVFQIGARINVAADGQEDVWALGGQVSVLGRADKDVWVAGGDVEIDVDAEGDLWAAGGRVAMRGSVGQDAWIAGATIDIAGTVGQDLRAAGATVSVAEGARVGDSSRLIGAFVGFRGAASGELAIAADEIVFSGTAAGPVSLTGRVVRITDGARIAGDVTVHMVGSPEVAPGAQIGGRLTVGLPEPAPSPGRDWSLYGMVSLAFAASAFMVAAAATFLAPALMATATGTLRSRPGLAFVNGLVAAIGGPLVALALIVILVTAPLGVFLFMAFPLLALLGHAIIGAVIGEKLLAVPGGKTGTLRRLAGLALGVVLVAAVGLLPLVGVPVVLALLVLGVGAALLALAEHLFGFVPKSIT